MENTSGNWEQLKKILNLSWKKEDLLKEALTHSSYLNEHRREEKRHNERLEFLGDAVLELVSSIYLYKQFPDEQEGFLTNLRAALVNTDNLTQVSQKLGINKCLRLSKGEGKNIPSSSSAILADALEAVIGAIYLDQGLGVASDFIVKNIMSRYGEIIDKKTYRDSKSLFQEMAPVNPNKKPKKMLPKMV
jgi:ribonuclease-3